MQNGMKGLNLTFWASDKILSLVPKQYMAKSKSELTWSARGLNNIYKQLKKPTKLETLLKILEFKVYSIYWIENKALETSFHVIEMLNSFTTEKTNSQHQQHSVVTLLYFALNSRSWGWVSYNSNTVQSIFKENQFSGSQGTAARCFSTILRHFQELSGGSGGMKLSERWKICCRPTASLMGILYCTAVKLKREWKEREWKTKANKGENVLWNITAQKKLKQTVEKR